MRLLSLTIIFLLLIPMFLTTPAIYADTPHQDNPRLVASLEVNQSGVELQRSGTEEWFAVVGRSPLVAGDRVRTDGTGEAVITWFDEDNFLTLAPTSEILIEDYSLSVIDGIDNYNISINLTLGRAFQSIRQSARLTASYFVQTPALTSAVRPASAVFEEDNSASSDETEPALTVFGVDVTDREETTLVVTDGLVAAIQGDFEHSVPGGFWLRGTPDAPPPEPDSYDITAQPETEQEVSEGIASDSSDDGELAASPPEPPAEVEEAGDPPAAAAAPAEPANTEDNSSSEDSDNRVMMEPDTVLNDMLVTLENRDNRFTTANPDTSEEEAVLQPCLVSPVREFGVNIRNGPSVNYEVSSQLQPGEILLVTGYTAVNQGWYRVSLGAEDTGWIAERVLSATADCETLRENPLPEDEVLP